MELHEIRANMVTLEVTDEATGETFRRELPIDFYETANTGMRRLKDLTGHGPDADPCGTHGQNYL